MVLLLNLQPYFERNVLEQVWWNVLDAIVTQFPEKDRPQ